MQIEKAVRISGTVFLMCLFLIMGSAGLSSLDPEMNVIGYVSIACMFVTPFAVTHTTTFMRRYKTRRPL